MCWNKTKKFGKVKEVEVSPSGEGTLSSGGEVGLISPGAESVAFKITASKRRRIKARLKATVARVKQNFAKHKRPKIPHKIYEHLKWITKAPAAHARVLLEASVDVEGYKACGEEFPGAAKRRSSDLRALPDTGCMATCMGVGQLRDKNTRSTGSRDEPERGKLNRDQHRVCHLPKVERREGSRGEEHQANGIRRERDGPATPVHGGV